MITVKVGYEIYDDSIQVEESEVFNTFDEANKWATSISLDEGYDTAKFEHSDGEEVMREIIMKYLEEQDNK